MTSSRPRTIPGRRGAPRSSRRPAGRASDRGRASDEPAVVDGVSSYGRRASERRSWASVDTVPASPTRRTAPIERPSAGSAANASSSSAVDHRGGRGDARRASGGSARRARARSRRTQPSCIECAASSPSTSSTSSVDPPPMSRRPSVERRVEVGRRAGEGAAGLLLAAQELARRPRHLARRRQELRAVGRVAHRRRRHEQPVADAVGVHDRPVLVEDRERARDRVVAQDAASASTPSAEPGDAHLAVAATAPSSSTMSRRVEFVPQSSAATTVTPTSRRRPTSPGRVDLGGDRLADGVLAAGAGSSRGARAGT